MEELLRLNNLTTGRDKFARLLQYASRTIWHILQTQGMSRSSIEKFKNLEYTFSSFRKLLRLGRCLDVMYTALKTINYPDQVVRLTLTMARISYSMFLLCDHIIWIGRAGLIDVNFEKWSTTANKYWLYTIILNLLRDYYEFCVCLKQCRLPNRSFPESLCRGVCSFLRSRKDLSIDTLKNLCDFFIPFTALGYAKITPGTVGVLGIISSIAGIISLVDPLAKLTPA